jgi:hypothetical protein
VTLGGIEMENEMYEWMPLKVKFLDGKGNLENESRGLLKVPMI